MGSPTFGKRVAGEKAYLEAVQSHQGGLEVFGKRVRGALPGSQATADQMAKSNSEFGFLVANNSEFTDTAGKKSTGIKVDDLEGILEENPTFFDSLYEAEMARPEGPRDEALRVFSIVEQGIKGQGRPHIVEEINAYLGLPDDVAQDQAEALAARMDAVKERQARAVHNVALRDVGRLSNLAERETALETLRESKSPVAKEAVQAVEEAEKQARDAQKSDTGARSAGSSGSAKKQQKKRARRSRRQTSSGTTKGKDKATKAARAAGGADSPSSS